MQLFVYGELLGGCDIVTELQAAGELRQTIDEKLAQGASQLRGRIVSLLASSPVMLFMKGTPEAPRCGFSRRVVEALAAAGVSFGSHDILADADVRQGLKEYSKWPTYPQLYANSELIGTCHYRARLRRKTLNAEIMGETAAAAPTTPPPHILSPPLHFPLHRKAAATS